MINGPFSSSSSSDQEGDISADQGIFAGPAVVGRRNTLIAGDQFKIAKGASVNLTTTISGSTADPQTASGLLRSAIEGQAASTVERAASSIASPSGVPWMLVAGLSVGVVTLLIFLLRR